ncbi:MAG: nucleotidyltransferase family protein [Candidatus Margulisiibacteriota bacterium]
MTYGLSEATLQKLQTFFEAQACLRSVILFGSRATGRFKPGSDIDLAVIGPTFEQLLAIRNAADDLYLPYKLDFVLYDTIDVPALKEHIDTAGIVLFRP